MTFGVPARTSTGPTFDTPRKRFASVRVRQTISRLPNARRHNGRVRVAPFVRHNIRFWRFLQRACRLIISLSDQSRANHPSVWFPSNTPPASLTVVRTPRRNHLRSESCKFRPPATGRIRDYYRNPPRRCASWNWLSHFAATGSSSHQ